MRCRPTGCPPRRQAYYDVTFTGASLVGHYTTTCSYAHSVEISGKVWNDMNANGVREVGEPGLAGWTVVLTSGQTAVTDGSGSYHFTGLKPGDYEISEVLQAGWTLTTAESLNRTITITMAWVTQ